jgi:hypothetical protein
MYEQQMATPFAKLSQAQIEVLQRALYQHVLRTERAGDREEAEAASALHWLAVDEIRSR